jgi:hypothetical protein
LASSNSLLVASLRDYLNTMSIAKQCYIISQRNKKVVTKKPKPIYSF